MPTLVMMHGMTGTSEMMRPFAEKILPEGWNLLVPQAEFEHPNRGYTWWRYEGGDNPGRRILTAKELSCLLYTSPSPRDLSTSRMPSSA